MGKNFSLKLALNNIRNNRKLYLPYILASVGIVAMFYNMAYIASSKGTAEISASLSVVMILGLIVIGIFSILFLFYINSFLMKKRKKEIGLYNILGMEKKHIGKILAIENFMVSAFSIIAGILCGILFSKLIVLLIGKVFDIGQPAGFELPPLAVILTLAFFAALFLVILAVNQTKVHLAKPIELLSGSSVGEKEPKTKIVMAVIGLICLGVGYYIAITTESPMAALMLFFVAVVLVIVGTYALFTAGSIAILKALKKNKKFYYKTQNFTAVSGMIYRMKQNAVGLANICILSTMVLVMLSGTISLNIGMQDVLDNRYPSDVNIEITSYDNTSDYSKIEDDVRDTARRYGMSVENVDVSKQVTFAVLRDGNDFVIPGQDEEDSAWNEKGTIFIAITAQQYNEKTGENIQLADDEILSYSAKGKLEGNFRIGDTELHSVGKLDKFTDETGMISQFNEGHFIVVANDRVFENLNLECNGGENAISYSVGVDMDGSQEQMDAFAESIRLHSDDIGMNYETMRAYSRESQSRAFFELTGSFLFLGIFLGTVFTFAAALIIYYKQISEGYYDKDKFEIMQKVGMSKSEVRKSVKKQVLMVFFIPLVMAGIHVMAAFPMISRLLTIFGLYNIKLFALCTLSTFAVFALIYGAVYAVTAREYYKIVG